MFLSNASEEEIELLHKLISKNVKHYRLEKEMSQLELALTIGLKSGAFFGIAENNTNGKHFNIEHIYMTGMGEYIYFSYINIYL